jgi:molecular chaperone GrpE
MNDRVDVEAILEKFRGWLEDARDEAHALQGIEPGPGAGPEGLSRDFGLIDLVEEFTALRHELKLQTKSGRSLIEQNENTISALRQAFDQLRAVDAKETQSAWTAGKGLAEALADLDEALVRGQREIEKARNQIADESVRALEATLETIFRRKSWISRRLLRSYHEEVAETVRCDSRLRHQLFESFLEGYGLIQKRLRRALASEQITHIACVGRLVDPELMTVIEVVDEPRGQSGTVVKELRRGYTWRGRVIRFAEVLAVRGAGNLPAAHESEDAPEMEPEEVDVEARTA